MSSWSMVGYSGQTLPAAIRRPRKTKRQMLAIPIRPSARAGPTPLIQNSIGPFRRSYAHSTQARVLDSFAFAPLARQRIGFPLGLFRLIRDLNPRSSAWPRSRSILSNDAYFRRVRRHLSSQGNGVDPSGWKARLASKHCTPSLPTELEFGQINPVTQPTVPFNPDRNTWRI